VVGIPGPLDASRRTVIDAPNLPSLLGLPLADALAKASGLPVWLEHDGALLLLGERAAGSARGSDLVLGVFFGTGIGAAFLKAGRPQKGGDFAMQLGHIPLRGDGRSCPCGGVDCIEAYASGVVLRDLAQRHQVRINRLFADRKTSPELDAALTRFVEDQAMAIATGMTLLDPEVAVIGGGVIEMAEFPVEALFAATRRRLSPMFDPSRKRLVQATLGWQAVLQGALAVVGQRDA
jgi:allose kinase